MKIIHLVHPGQHYVLFTREGQFFGRVIRRDALHVEIECHGEIIRLGVHQVHAVLETESEELRCGPWLMPSATA